MARKIVKNVNFDYSDLLTYYGYYKDDNKLLKCASGGFSSAAAEAIIKQKGVVFGAVYSKDFKRCEYKCVEDLEGLEDLKGSKYCETSKEIVDNDGIKNLFTVLQDKLKENRKVLFVGLGCDVGAVKAYCSKQNINTDNLYLIDILCYGPTLAEVHKQYIENLEKEYDSKIISFSTRYKKETWVPFYINAIFENNKVHQEQFYKSDYGFAFNKCSKQSCYECKFKAENHKGDVVCGDFWGSKKELKQWNNKGISIMFVRNKKGEELIDMIDKNEFYLEKADTLYALQNNHNYFDSRKKDRHRDKFVKDLNSKGLRYAVSHYPVGIKTRIKRILPKPLKNLIKSIIKK